MSVDSSKKIKKWREKAKKGDKLELEPKKSNDGAVLEITKVVEKL